MEKYKIKSRLWIELDGENLMGEGALLLLKTIDEEGSLSNAAKKLELSYKKAWKLLNNIKQKTHGKIISSKIGGKNGGGTELTAYGKKFVKKFEEIKHSFWIELDKKSKELDDL